MGDAIIVQAVANCLNLSINIAESNPNFAPVTVVQPINMTSECTNIYIGHIDETHYVSTVEKSTISSEHQQNNMKYGETLVENSLTDKNEKHRAYESKYMKEYMKKRRADIEFRKRENKNAQQRYNNIEMIREEKNQSCYKKEIE